MHWPEFQNIKYFKYLSSGRIHRARSGLWYLGLLVFVAMLAPGGAPARPAAFHFSHYVGLQAGDAFDIQASSGIKKGQTIGSGRIYQLDGRQLHLQFKANPGALPVEGEVRLQYLKRVGSKIHMQLSYRGVQSGLSRQNSERVLLDAFLADNGILSLHYADRKYFLQLSRNRVGHNKFVTDWGSARLIKK